MSARLSSPEDYTKLLDAYDTWMFDCDGVLWNGDSTVEGAIEVLKLLRTHSKLQRRYLLPLVDRLMDRETDIVCDEQRDKV